MDNYLSSFEALAEKIAEVLTAHGYIEEEAHLDIEDPFVVFSHGELRVALNYYSDEPTLMLLWAEGLTGKAPKLGDDGVPGSVSVPAWEVIIEETWFTETTSDSVFALKCDRFLIALRNHLAVIATMQR